MDAPQVVSREAVAGRRVTLADGQYLPISGMLTIVGNDGW
jgi:hypothetical protein